VVCGLLGGLETESEYPYEGMDEKCSFVKQEACVYINGSVNISKNEDGGRLLFVGQFSTYLFFAVMALISAHMCWCLHTGWSIKTWHFTFVHIFADI